MSSAENTSNSDESYSDSSDTSEESDISLPELIFYGKIPLSKKIKDANEDIEKLVCKPVKKLYVCEKTRPPWMIDVDNDPLHSEEFPTLPFSNESMEIYKRIKDSWKPKLTAEEQKFLFGTEDAFKSFDEEGLTIKCKSCNPKITPVVKLPENYRQRMITKLKFLTLIKESSKRERDRKAILRLREKARQPKNILKDIIDKAIQEVKEDLALDEQKLKTLKLGESPKLHKTDDDTGSDFSDLLMSTEDVKMEMSDTTKKLKLPRKKIKKTYLKPEKTEKSLKARFEKDQTKPLNLLEKLDRDDLRELKSYFYPKNCDYQKTVLSYGLMNERKFTGVPLKKCEFMKAINDIIGVEEYAVAAGTLFDSLGSLLKNQTIDEGFIWWDQFLDLMISSKEPSNMKSYSLIDGESETKFQPFSKSPIIKVISAICLEKCVFIALARLGEVSVMDEYLEILHTYKVPLKHNKSRNSCWLTDACYSLETETLFVVSSARCLYLYNTSRSIHKLVQTLTGMLEIPECLNYTTLKPNEGLLLVGDNKGSIISFNFKQTKKSFFKIMPNKDGTQTCYWQDVINETEWAEIVFEKNVHKDLVTQVLYIIKSDSIISSSMDVKKSLAIRQRQPNRKPYIFKIEKGIKSFSIDNNLGLIATICGDTMLRLWDLVNTRSPVGFLRGHNAIVLDVILLSIQRVAISYAEDKEIKVWNTETFGCLQTIKLKFEHIPHTRHVILNVHAIHTDYQTSRRNPKASLSSGMTSSEGKNYQDTKILKHILVVNLNNVKMLRIKSNDYAQEAGDSKNDSTEDASDHVLDEKLSDVTESDETDREEDYIHLDDFLTDTSDDNESDSHQLLNGTEFLEDFVKEGTPYLALKLYEPSSINSC